MNTLSFGTCDIFACETISQNITNTNVYVYIYTYTCKTVRPYGFSILVHLGIHRQKCGKVKHFLSPTKAQIPYKYLKSTQNDAICQPLTRYSVFDLGIPGEDSQGK